MTDSRKSIRKPAAAVVMLAVAAALAVGSAAPLAADATSTVTFYVY